MTPWKALIVDDEALARLIVRTMLQTEPDMVIIGEAANGTDATLKILQQKPDVVFLDIQMAEADGFEVLREIWPYHRPAVVFTTAYDRYAIRAFEVSAVDYLLKPFTEIRFQQALARVRRDLLTSQRPGLDTLVQSLPAADSPAYLKRILVKDKRKQCFVRLDEVFYLDATGNYITLHTKTRDFLIHESLSRLETRLDPNDFVRINRSYIINLNYVQEIENYFNGEFHVTLTNGVRLKWSRFYRDNIKAFYARNE
ncbi:LytR/AlgR family response regulator transcription factor [Larkinella soli]|uniref:LytR/AlgR family response regulator transcription factor n=1 Tax=Larkinella soli TaxID=1770527 RepID=UPI000FFC6DEC|nr:LytTR family DNA-binding domain-containing protein [Larkinella soli]